MKWVINMVGVILVVVGIIWLFQGIDILPGSFMSGRSLYAILGVVLGVIGVLTLAYNNRRRRV